MAVFPVMNTAFGLPAVMLLFTGLAIIALFVARYVPETKGLSVEEVVEVFERQSGATSPPAQSAGRGAS